METETVWSRADLPADKGAESCLLGLMIVEPGKIGKVLERINENVFFYPANKLIYRAILTLYTSAWKDDQSPVGSYTVLDELKRMGKHTANDTDAEDTKVSESYLQQVVESAPEIANVEYYADLALEYSRDRELLVMGTDIEKIINQPGRPNEKIQHIQERVLQLEALSTDKKVIGFGDNLIQRAQALQGDSPGRIDSGFIAIDHKTRGFYPGDLIVIGARPSMGKTSLALNIALNTARAGTGVLFISLEMAAQQIQDRALCMLAGLPFSDIRHNPGLDSTRKQALFEAAQKYEREKLPLFITTAGHTPAQQAVLLKQYRQGHDIGLVIIDYLQLMMSDQKQQDLWHTGAVLSRAIKRMAQTEEVPAIVASQLSPEPESRENTRPHISDLRESGSTDQDADVIMLLFREDYYRRYDMSYGPTETCEIDLAKQRNGPTGLIKLTFDKRTMTFTDYAGAY